MKLYLDEDAMKGRLASALRLRGFDVLTPHDSGLLSADDETQLEFAAKTERVLYTFNISDFYRLHCGWLSRNRAHAGMILVAQQTHSIGEQLRRISKIDSARKVEEMRSRVEFLSNWG